MGNRRLLSADDRRRKIVVAARRLFARDGFSGTTSAALAKACRVSEALIYKLFTSKRKLYAAIVEHTLETWGPLVVEGSPEADLEQVLVGLAEQIFDRVVEDPDFVRLMGYADLQAQRAFSERFMEARGTAAIESLRGHLTARARAGQLRLDVDTRVVAMAFLCQVWHYATGIKVFGHEKHHPAVPDHVAIRTMATVFARGLRL